MDYEKLKQISRIFDRMLTLPPERRTDYIDTLCGSDPVLQKKIEELLAIHDQSEELFEHHLQKNKELLNDLDSRLSKTISLDEDFFTGETLGRWTLKELLGRGGMGSVYKAERTNEAGIRQVGAFKIIHKNLITPLNIERFNLEQQILAGLNHPNIAGFIDSGITSEGIPYMVMEFVEGKTLLDYCNEQAFSIEQRLEMFKAICQAIQYAHKNLVVHRDLKPENILVSEEGRVKILDFGIAKLLDHDLYKLSAAETLPGMRLMSLEYAAPEQVAGSKVTTSTDVYALGIVLYQLLTELHPFDFEKQSYRKIEKIILETEPARPSLKLAHCPDSEQIQSIVETRNIQPADLIKALKGDLDAIVQKTLKKDPEYRYVSAEALENDLDRFLKGLPILARPDTIDYRVRKFIERHRAGVISTAVIILCFISFAVLYTVQVTAERNRAEQAAIQAQLEADKATRIKDFMATLFESGSPYSPQHTGEILTASKLLDNGLTNIQSELTDEPEVYTEMLSVIGRSFIETGDYEKARTSLEESLQISLDLHGGDHPMAATNMSLLGRLEGRVGNYETALNWLNKALTINENLGFERVSAKASNHADVAYTYALAKDFEKATENYKKALHIYQELGAENSRSAALTLSNLANVQHRQKLFEEAEKNTLSALTKLKNIYGEEHLSIANTYSSLATLYRATSNFKESENYFKKSIALSKKLAGNYHPDIINDLNSYGLLLHSQGKYPEAEKQFNEVLYLFKETGQTDSLTYSAYLNNLALVKMSMKQNESAAKLYDEVLAIKRKKLNADNPSITITLYNQATLFHSMKDLDKAQTLFEEVVERDKQKLGHDHPEVAVDLVKLASVYRDQLAFEKAGKTFSEAKTIFEYKYQPDHYRLGEYFMEYGRQQMMQQTYQEAILSFENSISIFEKNYGPEHEKITTVRDYLAECIDKSKS